MTSNILIAIKNLVDNHIFELISHYSGRNRANGVGDALEKYVKDLFANTLFCNDENEKNQMYSEIFSYLGNQNNPPDMMLRGGDAIEVKKVQGNSSALALNSSYPKDKLCVNSKMITTDCRNCEDWSTKDLLYVVGHTDDKNLKELWFVYGDCYAANKDIYERIKNTVISGLHSISDIELAKTNELGKIKKVDPLGITDLRVRGMWSIFHPNKVFNYLTKQNIQAKFRFYCVIKTEKFNSFSDTDKENIYNLVDNKKFFIQDARIKNPNNPATLMDVKFMEFYYE